MCSFEKKSSDPLFWSCISEAEAQIKNNLLLKEKIHSFEDISNTINELDVLFELDADEEELSGIISSAFHRLDAYKKELMFSQEHDVVDAILEINAGAGGTESQDFAFMLMRAYHKWASKNNYTLRTNHLNEGDNGGVKSCSFIVSGKYAYGKLRSEYGVHRLTRVSPFDKKKRTHTSFVSISVFPLLDDKIEVELRDDEVEWEFFRGTGAGGQHRNKVETAVRVRHLSTGLYVECQQERSQWKNRETALKMLKMKLFNIELEKKQKSIQKIHDNSSDVAFGHQIRSYVLNGRQMIKDHRTGTEVFDVDSVLDGGMDIFMETFLLQQKRNQ